MQKWLSVESKCALIIRAEIIIILGIEETCMSKFLTHEIINFVSQSKKLIKKVVRNRDDVRSGKTGAPAKLDKKLKNYINDFYRQTKVIGKKIIEVTSI